MTSSSSLNRFSAMSISILSLFRWHFLPSTSSLTTSCGIRGRGRTQGLSELQLGCRDRLAKQKSLHLIAACKAQQIVLLWGFDPFRNSRHAQTLGERVDGADDGCATSVLHHGAHEGTVDFDLVER